MKILLRYKRRLGDIVGCLPAALHLQRQGHEVWFETDPQFADLFKCVDYVSWKNPYLNAGTFDRTLDLQIHDGSSGGPRYHAFRASRKHWRDFVYDHDLIRAAAWDKPVFTTINWFDPADYGLPADGNYALVGASGVSQQQKHDPKKVRAKAKELWPDVPHYVLSAEPTVAEKHIYCRRLRDLPGLLRHARHCMLINSGPAVVALGVRETYHHIPQVGTAAQDDSSLPGISIPVVL